MLVRVRFALPMLVLLFASGIGLAVFEDNLALANDAKTVTVTEKENGAKVKLAKGDTLVVRLEVQSGTAFGWKIAKNDDKVIKPPGKPEIERPDKPKPGGKVTQIFRFSAEASGNCELELHYVRPFDKDKAPAKTFKLSVTAE